MMKRVLPISGLLLLLLLSACTVIIDPFPGADVVSANQDPNLAVDQGTLSAGGSVVYQVNLSTQVRGRPVVYLEVNQSFEMTVFNSLGLALASSTSAQFFATGTTALQAGLEAESVSTQIQCRGACVLLDPTNRSILYVRLRNPGNIGVNYSLFAYGDNLQDQGETANDTPAGAVSLTTSDQGAIEILGDLDYFRAQTSGTLQLSSQSQIQVRAVVTDALGNPTGLNPIGPGQTVSVLQGDFVRVYALDNARAGASQASFYDLSFAGN